ncbi:MAG: GNAT family N-acetyltransferase [Acidobacteria bacterium]|nr:GNAT family N-acetyltransferase [Acidobacteriota bacterium]
MAKDIHIRLATGADAPTIAVFGRQTFHDAFAADNHPDDLKAYLDVAFELQRIMNELNDELGFFMLAEHANAPLGYLHIRNAERPDCVGDCESHELVRFYVDRMQIGGGLAHTLMEAGKREAVKRGATSLWLGVWERNARAIAFYKKNGFQQVGTKAFVLGSDLQTDHVMFATLHNDAN